MMRFIDNLIITQDGIRDRKQIGAMMNFVASGGFFTKDTLKQFGGDISPIKISRFEDEQEYIHGGHHRALSIYLAGRPYLLDEEYSITEFRYEDYLRCVLEKHFITPFDPRTHCRLADFEPFRREALELLARNPADVPFFVALNAHRYRTPRRGRHLRYLAQSLLHQTL